MNRIQAIALSIGATAALVACGSTGNTTSSSSPSASPVSGTVTAAGSTALQPLVAAAKEGFESANPQATVNVTGGGSGQGLSLAASGAVDLGDSDIPASAAANLTGGDQLVDHQVAVVPFVIIANPSVDISGLTQKQAQDIFSGAIKDWKDVGGKAGAIQVILRPKTSGTRATFKKIVLADVSETASPAAIQDSTKTVVTQVGQTPGAISYVSLGGADATVKKLQYEGVDCTPDNVIAGKYKIFSHEHMYTKGEAKGAVKAFIDFILSDTFQNGTALTKLGFIPVKKVTAKSPADS